MQLISTGFLLVDSGPFLWVHVQFSRIGRIKRVYYGREDAGSNVFFEVQLGNRLAGRGRGPEGKGLQVEAGGRGADFCRARHG